MFREFNFVVLWYFCQFFLIIGFFIFYSIDISLGEHLVLIHKNENLSGTLYYVKIFISGIFDSLSSIVKRLFNPTKHWKFCEAVIFGFES